MEDHVFHQLEKTGVLDELGEENIYIATSTLGDSTLAAYYDAEQWIAERNQVLESPEESA